MDIHGLQNIANKVNPTGFKQWLKKYIKKSQEDDSLVANTDNDACLILYKLFRDKIIVVKNRLFMKVNHIWVSDVELINEHLLRHILNSNIKRKVGDNLQPFVQNIKSAKNVRETLINKLKTEDELQNTYEKFHNTTKNKLAFLDGVLDFQAQQFYLWEEINFEYYSTMQIQRKFHPYYQNPNLIAMSDIQTKLFETMFGNDTMKALQFFARGIAGNCEDKNWASYVGNRDCGKGVFNDALKYAFEDYVQPFELGNILHERSSNCEEISRKLYWLLDFEFVRLGISQETPEPDSNLKLNSKIQKKLSGGGDTHVARRNYDRVDTKFLIDTTFCYMGNHELKADSNDVFEHHIEFSSVVQFKSQEEINIMRENGENELLINSFKIKDPNIKPNTQTEEWKNAMVMLLFLNWKD